MRFFSTLATVILFAWPLAARADGDDVDLARTKFSEGVRLYRAGDDLGARAAFLEAEKAHHASVTLYNLALVEERLLHAQAAVDDYERYLAEAGENGEFSSAAAIAIAELRRRSGKVRIETNPQGAVVFIDGAPLDEPSPLSVLLLAGKHHITVEWKDARASADADVQAATPNTVRIEHPAPDPVKQELAAPKEYPPPPKPPADPEVAGLVFGGGFYAFPFAFIKSGGGSSPVGSQGVFGGLSAEIGYAFAEHAYVGLRGYAAIGPSCGEFFGAHMASIGPTIEYHVTRPFWIGASVNGGNGRDCTSGTIVSTDIEFSPMFSASYAVTSQSYGQWLVTAGIGYFFTNPTTNGYGLLYAPIGFGPRFY